MAPALPADASQAELLASLACDAQTSGGLVLCVPADRAAACVDELCAARLQAAVIGELLPAARGHHIELL